MKSRLRRPSPALIISVIALVAALGGTAYAVKKIGTKQIKNGAVTKPKLHGNSVATGKVINGAITDAKLNPSVRGKAVAWAEVAANGTVTKSRDLSQANVVKPGGAGAAFFCLANLPTHGAVEVTPVFGGDANEFGFPAVAADEQPFASGDATCDTVSGGEVVVATYFLGLGTTASTYTAQPFTVVLVK
jgi:hypothetical protein